MTEKQTENKYHQNFSIGYISELDALTKLRIIVITIFILSTVSIPLLIYGFIISAFLLIISYILVLVLLIKLMIIKKL
jgi:hypothetical protein